MSGDDLKQRTMQFALRVMKLVDSLPKTRTGEVLGKQLLRSGTSVGANYRSACRSRSHADFISRTAIAQEEADESLYWMELLAQAKIVPEDRLVNLMQEANELVAILTASIKTARKNAARPHK